ncbi:MAG: glycosyltransferase family 1 protein [Prevotellaceae bacterium]|nr:glycosyltransferase family 1 protein [Prevotellaceae bacterium]
MRILLLGEYSGVHSTLSEALRDLGHKVTVASNGDFWKDYPRDIDLARRGTVDFLWKVMRALPRMRGYDVVQLINPMFMEMKAERLVPIYHYLRKYNGKVVLSVLGADYYYPYINRNMKPMRYSDYNNGDEERHSAYTDAEYADWIGTAKGRLCRRIAADCDAIIAGTYEYWLPYNLTDDRGRDGRPLRDKLHLVPFPFKPVDAVAPVPSERLRVFIGISKARSEFKGTDIMLKAAQDVMAKYPDHMELNVVTGVPYSEYQHTMDNSDVVLDQLYSYGPGMNALLSLSKGIITFTGGEPEHYDIMGERQCRPIVNVRPCYESVYGQLERLVLHPENIMAMKRASRDYVLRNYEYHRVAERYIEIYKSL